MLECEATKTIKELKAEVKKLRTENAEFRKSTSSLENFLSQAWLDVRATKTRAKKAEEKLAKEARDPVVERAAS